MMKSVFLVIFISFLPSCLSGAIAAEFDYKQVYRADTGKVDKYIVRYLTSFAAPCVTVQTFIPGGDGKIFKEKEFCSIDGKNLIDGYSEVELKKGEFKEGRLVLTFEVTPLAPVEGYVEACDVTFENGSPQGLFCKKA